MSVASQNLFALLDEDSSKATPARDVKKTPASKKSDSSRAPRPASNKKPFSSTNDAAFRDREIGRSANRGKTLEPKSDSSNRRTRAPKLDRHSRTGKVDSEKKIEKGWGDNKKELDDEVAGEAIAKADEAADAAEDAAATPVEEAPKTISLDAYLDQVSLEQKEISSEVSLRQANDGKDISGAVLKRQEEDFVAASKLKKEKSKKPKEKLTLDVEPVFANPERRERSERPERRGGDRRSNDRRPNNRGGKSTNSRSGPKSSGPRAGQQKTVNLSSKDEFPALGA